MRAQLRELDQRIAAFDAEFVAAARSDVTARRLSTIFRIGSSNATALMTAVGNAVLLAPAISRLGSVLSRGKSPQEAGPGCSAFA